MSLGLAIVGNISGINKHNLKYVKLFQFFKIIFVAFYSKNATHFIFIAEMINIFLSCADIWIQL